MESLENIKSLLTFHNGLKLVGSLVISAFSYYTLKIYLLRRKYAHIPGPKTRGILGFYLGNALDVDNAIKKTGKIFADVIAEWHEQFGPVLKFQTVNIMMVSTIDQETVKQILVVKNEPKEPFFTSIIGYPFSTRFMGYGLVTDPDNNRWRAQRAIFNPGFHRNVLMNFVKHFNTKADLLLERLRTMADGKTVVKLFPEINRAALDVIAMIAFGMNLDSISGKDTIFNEYIGGLLQVINKAFLEPLYKMKPKNWGEIENFKMMLRYLRNVGKARILERIEAMDRGETFENDILSGILKGAKTEKIDLEMMIDNFLTFFIAGQETTANVLAFSFLELGKNKEIFNKCREEVDEILGSRQEITYEDVTKMKYISSVFKETLRLYPPAPVISRLSTDELNIAGYRIPANSSIFLSSYVSSRMEQYFPEPTVFKPERFIKNADTLETGAQNYTYYPFSIGPRNCIGQNFAQIEGIAVIAKIVQNFDYDLDPNQSFKVEQSMTIRPLDGTQVILKLRK